MNSLLYSSNEMFSSTDLIRKSKMIFDKINTNEIDKAIILRDGKPNFMLLNFSKYEEIMAEYDMLKEMYGNSITKEKHIQVSNISINDSNVENNLIKFEEIINDVNNKNDTSSMHEVDIDKENDVGEQVKLITEEVLVVDENYEDKEKREFKENEEIELLKALEQLEALNLDPVLKEEAKVELKEKKKAEIKEFWN